ncbi:hypothetical protein Taro_010826 [Colocasia esculenta]|uniref:Uncharacterized protein n=1 Tax=Colocasia esculenta TaxID=4460 RepID=A0A843U8X5_COLES|nr:hypothetical protein [Colocasia esculenta]
MATSSLLLAPDGRRLHERGMTSSPRTPKNHRRSKGFRGEEEGRKRRKEREKGGKWAPASNTSTATANRDEHRRKISNFPSGVVMAEEQQSRTPSHEGTSTEEAAEAIELVLFHVNECYVYLVSAAPDMLHTPCWCCLIKGHTAEEERGFLQWPRPQANTRPTQFQTQDPPSPLHSIDGAKSQGSKSRGSGSDRSAQNRSDPAIPSPARPVRAEPDRKWMVASPFAW